MGAEKGRQKRQWLTGPAGLCREQGGLTIKLSHTHMH